MLKRVYAVMSEDRFKDTFCICVTEDKEIAENIVELRNIAQPRQRAWYHQTDYIVKEEKIEKSS